MTITEMGSRRITEEVLREQECEVCGVAATRCITFVFHHGRTNPESNAYGKDDISYCEDKRAFTCENHEPAVRAKTVTALDMDWCMTFPRSRFPHLFLTWVHVSQIVVSPVLSLEVSTP